MADARARAKARQVTRATEAAASLVEHKTDMTFEEVVTKHFTGVPAPQQWIDRLGKNQAKLARIKLSNREAGVRPKILSPLAKEEILVRELDKLPAEERVGVILYPRFNGGEPPPPIPAKPWEVRSMRGAGAPQFLPWVRLCDGGPWFRQQPFTRPLAMCFLVLRGRAPCCVLLLACCQALFAGPERERDELAGVGAGGTG
jgi:hypothetical protein